MTVTMNEVNNFASVIFMIMEKFKHFALDLGIFLGAATTFGYSLVSDQNV